MFIKSMLSGCVVIVNVNVIYVASQLQQEWDSQPNIKNLNHCVYLVTLHFL